MVKSTNKGALLQSHDNRKCFLHFLKKYIMLVDKAMIKHVSVLEEEKE